MTANLVDRGVKPRVTGVLVARFARYHGRHPDVFHIVLDDKNLSRGHAAACLDRATDDEGKDLGEKLVLMSWTQRLKLARKYHEHMEELRYE